MKVKLSKKKKIIVIAIVVIILIIGVVIAIKLNNNNDSEDPLYAKRADQSDEERVAEIEANGTMEEPESYEANIEYTENADITEEEITSTGFEENAVLVSNGANTIFTNTNIIRNAKDSDDETGAKRFGIGAAVLAKNATAHLSNCNITTTGKGATGIFSYGSSLVTISDSTIVTNSNNSGGIHAANGGSVVADNVNVTTYGENSAGLRSEADGMVMEISNSNIETNGQDSPAIYSLAIVNVTDSILTSNNSEGAYIDGGHSITLTNCKLTSNMMEVYQRYNYNGKALLWTVGIGQTMTKDESKIGKFKMIGGSLISKSGGIFYTTNTISQILMKDVDITYSDSCDFFLKCTGNKNVVEEKGTWGQIGNNGARCNFTGINQKMEGTIYWDSISQLDFYMTDGSELKGKVIDDESSVDGAITSGSKQGYCNMYISQDSTWTVTGDSTLRTLSNEGKIVDASGHTVTIKGNNGKVYVKGDSSYTITVDRYLETADLSGALSD